MKRRSLLKALGISAVGLATVPLWMDSWTSEKLPSDRLNLKDDQKLMLAGIVDTIIPATETPGAKELEVDKFISTMVADCFELEVQEEFIAGFDELDDAAKEMYNQTFMKISDAERTPLLSTLESAEKMEGKQINFVAFVKELTVMGYGSSQYVLENIFKYELVPSRFHGSFPIKNTIYKDA